MSPMPGSLVSLNVAAGDEVVEGQEVAVLEAMKVSRACRLPRCQLLLLLLLLLLFLAVCLTALLVRQWQMRNVIRAERSGTVKSVVATVGDTLQADDIMMEFE